MIDRVLGDAMRVSESMRARGFGSGKSSRYARFGFDKRDLAALLIIAAQSGIIIATGAMGALRFRTFPSIRAADISPMFGAALFAYISLLLMPFAVRLVYGVKYGKGDDE